jgi:hypothetical protein
VADKIDPERQHRKAMMMIENDPKQVFPITPSTAFLALSGLVTIRDNDDELYDAEASAFCDYLLRIILAQPETVLAMQAIELDSIGETLISNCEAWLAP